MLFLTVIIGLGAGCGSQNDFISTQPQEANGSLLFQFQKQVAAQTADVVPGTTTTLRFDFFTGSTPTQQTFAFTESRAFSTSVSFTGVPSNIQSVLVTALDSSDLPIATLQGSFQVVTGQTITVDLDDSVPVTLTSLAITPETVVLAEGQQQATAAVATFSTGATATIPGSLLSYSFSPSNNTATVNASGTVFFSTAGQNSVLTGSLTLNGVTQTDTVNVRTVAFAASADTQSLTAGANTVTFSAVFNDSDGATQLNISEANLSFALGSAPTGTTINSTGDITIPNGVTSGTVEVNVSWTDARGSNDPLATGKTFTDTVTFTVTSGNGGNAGNG